MGKRPRINEIDQVLVFTIGLVLVGLIYLVFIHEEQLPYCSPNLSIEEALERGCPAPPQDVRVIG